MVDDKVVETARGAALADEYGVKFFETSAKGDTNVTVSHHASESNLIFT
jgi:hypothetical protein